VQRSIWDLVDLVLVPGADDDLAARGLRDLFDRREAARGSRDSESGSLGGQACAVFLLGTACELGRRQLAMAQPEECLLSCCRGYRAIVAEMRQELGHQGQASFPLLEALEQALQTISSLPSCEDTSQLTAGAACLTEMAATALIQRKRFSEARSLVEEWTRPRPGAHGIELPGPEGWQGTVCHVQAVCLAREGRTEDALAHLLDGTASQQSCRRLACQLLLSQATSRSRDKEYRQSAAAEVVALLSGGSEYPPDSEELGFLGVALFLRGEPAAAQMAFERSLQADPEHLSAVHHLARLFWHGGNLEAVRELLLFLLDRPRTRFFNKPGLLDVPLPRTLRIPGRPDLLWAVAAASCSSGDWKAGLVALEELDPWEEADRAGNQDAKEMGSRDTAHSPLCLAVDTLHEPFTEDQVGLLRVRSAHAAALLRTGRPRRTWKMASEALGFCPSEPCLLLLAAEARRELEIGDMPSEGPRPLDLLNQVLQDSLDGKLQESLMGGGKRQKVGPTNSSAFLGRVARCTALNNRGVAIAEAQTVPASNGSDLNTAISDFRAAVDLSPASECRPLFNLCLSLVYASRTNEAADLWLSWRHPATWSAARTTTEKASVALSLFKQAKTELERLQVVEGYRIELVSFLAMEVPTALLFMRPPSSSIPRSTSLSESHSTWMDHMVLEKLVS